MPQDPSVKIIPLGPQFFVAPQGTFVPDVEGNLIDVSGKRITVFPNRSGPLSDLEVLKNLGGGTYVLKGLRNIEASDVGAAYLTTFPPGETVPGVSGIGFFKIEARGTGYWTESESVVITDTDKVPLGSFNVNPRQLPSLTLQELQGQAANQALWFVFKPSDYLQGDPLWTLADRVTELRTDAQRGAERFADYDATLPPNIVNDPFGVFNRVQKL